MKHVIMTIDTESHVGRNPIDNLIWGLDINGQRSGIPLIMNILESEGVKGLFFVDIAEAWDYGEEKIAEVITNIKERGHDVGVHIHPDHMADKKRVFLSEYSYEEQYNIIKKCTDFYAKVTGENPIAFRAGKYGANHDTLAILSRLGYRADFSEFYGSKWCHINPPVTDNLSVKLENGLIEIPVMSYENYVKGLFHRFDKLDINRSGYEHRYILKRIEEEKNINVVTLFAHSFSLLKWRLNPDKPVLDNREVIHLKKAVHQVNKSQNLKFAALDEILSLDFGSSEGRTLSVFNVKGFIAFILYIQKGYRTLLSWIQIWLRKKHMGERAE